MAQFYLDNRAGINNWDLVDLSAPNILGHYVYHHDPNKEFIQTLHSFSRSTNLWERRISVVSLLYGIRRSEFDDALQICKTLLNDDHHLIHKSSGWMLREIGNRSKETLISFSNENVYEMPRTCLRYSIEKLSNTEKKIYMEKPSKFKKSKSKIGSEKNSKESIKITPKESIKITKESIKITKESKKKQPKKLKETAIKKSKIEE